MSERAAVVLVVDDEDAGRFVKSQTLRRAGFEVHEAATGQAGLSLAEQLSPDLVVLDVNLPDMSGLEVTRRLRARDGESSTLPVLQVSNTAITIEDRVKGLEQGADVYLTEPIDAGILVATVRALLRARRAETQLAAALERERAARSAAEDANRLKDDFIATLSHELRTPVNALMGWIWQLRHSTLDDNARARALESLERNARMQGQLVNDLLDISRVGKGKLHLRMQRIDLRDVVHGAVDSVREAAAQKRVEVTVAGDEPSIVVGDHARLQQVVTNLLANAVQFTPQSGRIAVAIGADENRAIVTVSDNGEGIEPAFLPYVFDQFRQGEGGLTRKHGGLGLGLTVVRQLVELHGGTVGVSSTGRGAGTTFTVTLPREAGAAAVEAPDRAPLVLASVRVLVVQDAPSDLVEILETSGAEATAVDSAQRAVDVLEQHATDVVVTSVSARFEAGGVPVVAASNVNAGQLIRLVMAASLPTSGR